MINLEYTENGINKVEQYATIEEAEKRAAELNLEDGDGEAEGSYRLTENA